MSDPTTGKLFLKEFIQAGSPGSPDAVLHSSGVVRFHRSDQVDPSRTASGTNVPTLIPSQAATTTRA